MNRYLLFVAALVGGITVLFLKARREETPLEREARDLQERFPRLDELPRP